MLRQVKLLVYTVGVSATLSTGQCGRAFPTTAPLWGPTGLGTVPTTTTVSKGSVETSLGYERIEPTGGSVRYFPKLTGTYGFGRGEIGAAYTRERFSTLGTSSNNNLWAAHGKYRLLEGRSGGAIAAGAHHLDLGSSAGGQVTSFYLVGSVPIWRSNNGAAAVAHLGAIQNRLKTTGLSSHSTRPMAGVELRLRQNWSLAADYTARDNGAARLMSLVARYEAPAGWGGQVGVGKIGEDTKLFADVIYRFGVSNNP